MMALWICKLPYRVSWCLEETQGNKEEKKKRQRELCQSGVWVYIDGLSFSNWSYLQEI